MGHALHVPFIIDYCFLCLCGRLFVVGLFFHISFCMYVCACEHVRRCVCPCLLRACLLLSMVFCCVVVALVLCSVVLCSVVLLCFVMCFRVQLCSTSPPGRNQVDGLPPARHLKLFSAKSNNASVVIGRPRASANIYDRSHRKVNQQNKLYIYELISSFVIFILIFY